MPTAAFASVSLPKEQSSNNMAPESQPETRAQRLPDFLRAHQREIISSWALRVRSLSPARELSDSAIIRHLPEILMRMADVLESARSDHPGSLKDLSQVHVLDRRYRAIGLDQLVIEYGSLRRAILDRWEAQVGRAISLAEFRNLDAALDDLLVESAKRYSVAREPLATRSH